MNEPNPAPNSERATAIEIFQPSNAVDELASPLTIRNARGFLAWLLQIALMLIVFASSQAGYYYGKAYQDFAEHGWYTSRDTITNSLSLIGTAGSVAAGFCLLMIRRRDLSPVVVGFLLVQSYFAFSTIWSNSPGDSLVIVAKSVLYLLALNIIVRKLSYLQVAKALMLLTLILCVVGLAVSYRDAAFATSIGAAGWRGLFMHKNHFAGYCLFVSTMILPLVFVRGARISAMLTLLVVAVSLYMSQGKTAQIELAIYALSLSVGFTLLRRGFRSVSLVRGLSTIALVGTPLALSVLALLVWAGYVTFTGRTNQWNFYLSDLGDNFLFGAGGFATMRDIDLSERAVWAGVNNSSVDSSVVSVLYNFGIIGLLAWVGFLLFCWFRILRSAYVMHAFVALATLAVFFYFSFLESWARLDNAFPNLVICMQFLYVEKLAAARKEGRVFDDDGAYL